MCDLWRHTTLAKGPPGSISAQVAHALQSESAKGAHWLKLYNAGSFFDAGAIPTSEHPGIAALCHSFQRVIVENHPKLVGDRVERFQSLLRPAELEIAMGLETCHPQVLARLNKGMSLDDFRRAAEWIRSRGIRLRAFVLIQPPFLISEAEALDWACRTIEFAWNSGVQVVSLIPTRGGNGAMDELAKRGHFLPPSLGIMEAAFRHGIASSRGLVLMDLWNVDAPGPLQSTDTTIHRQRLEAMNLAQQWIPPVE